MERSSGEKILIISPRIKSVVVSQVPLISILVQQKRLGQAGHCPGALQSRLLHLSYLMLTFPCPDLVIFCPVTGPADWGPLQVQWDGPTTTPAWRHIKTGPPVATVQYSHWLLPHNLQLVWAPGLLM